MSDNETKIHIPKGMEKIAKQRETMREFWTQSREELLSEKNINKIYIIYKDIYKEDFINEFIFREYIRKNGYCNACGEENKCRRCCISSLPIEERDEARSKLKLEKRERHLKLKLEQNEHNIPQIQTKDENKPSKSSKYAGSVKNRNKYSKEGRLKINNYAIDSTS
jgi:hypothetical protein